MKRLFSFLLLSVMFLCGIQAQRMTQRLGRGVVVSTAGSTSLVSWRRLAQEPENATYHVYVRPSGGAWTRLNSAPVARTCYSVSSSQVPAGSEVAVTLVSARGESEVSTPFSVRSNAWNNVVLDINFETAVLQPNDYRAKFLWPADLDGDGEMEFVVDRLSTEDFTVRSHKLQAYDRTGRCLWTVDMGPNVNICGGQNDMVTVGDVDLDGCAEVVIRSSDGTRFWDAAAGTWGKYACGSSVADVDGDGIVVYASQGVRNAPYYCSVIDGRTGAEKAWAELNYAEATDGADAWKRTNRADYMDFGYATMEGHFGLAYLDGVHPSVVQECQTRTNNGNHHTYVFVFSYDFSSGSAARWHHARTTVGKGSSFHQIRIADMDGDGCDEMVQGGYWVNPLQNRWMDARVAHGDRFRISDIDPDRPGMEVYAIQQYALLGQLLYDAKTGEHIKEWYLSATGDVGRGECMDVDASRKGYEIYSTMANLYDCKGNVISEGGTPFPYEGIWWDADLAREVLSSPGGSGWGTNVMITKYDGTRLIQMSRESGWQVFTSSANRPLFFGDVLGDWREEVILAKQNDDYSQGFVVYSTSTPTSISMYTLLEDPHYAGDITTRGYYQSPNTSFYLGYDMPAPPLPPLMRASVVFQSGAWTPSLSDGRTILFDLTGDNSAPIALSAVVQPDTVFFMPPSGHDFVVEGTGAIGGNADIWKSQQGCVTLNASIATGGTTYISEGTLCVNGSIQGPVSLRARGTLAGNAVLQSPLSLEGALHSEGGRLMPGGTKNEIGTMTLQAGLKVDKLLYLQADIDETSVPQADMLRVEGDLQISDSLVLHVMPKHGSLQPGAYPLISYTRNFVGSLARIGVMGLSGLSYEVKDVDKVLTLIIHEQRSAKENVRWTGMESAVWNYQSSNFQLADAQATEFVAGDAVVFVDGAAQSLVQIPELMPTAGVVVDNATTNFTFQGDGGLSGEGGLTKRGAGTLTLSAKNSDYTGPTLIEGGTLVVTELAKGGQPSSIGAAGSAATNLKIGRATLDVANISSATDRGVTLTDSAVIRVNSGSLTLQGIVTGSGSLTKTGGGQLTLAYGAANTWMGGTILQSGTLGQGAWNTSFGASGSPLRVTGNATISIFNNNSTSAVPRLRHAVSILSGKTLTIVPGQRCVLAGSLAGEGNLKLAFPYVRGDFAMTAADFAGVLNPTSGQMRLSQSLNMPRGTYTPAAGVYTVGVKSQSGTEQSYTHTLGALSSTAADASFGIGVWNVGSLGTDTEFAGTFNAAATLNKYGTGQLTLSGSSAAPVHVREGILALNCSDAATTTGLVTVYAGAMAVGTGKAAAVRVNAGATLGAGRAAGILPGTLTLEGNLTVVAGGRLRIRGRAASSIDKFSISGNVSLTSPVFVMERLSGDWEEGRDYQIFTGTGAVTLSGTPTFEPAVPKAGYVWDISRLASEGVISVVADPVGIHGVEAEKSDLLIYDAAGRRVKNMEARGVYMVNGRKIVR